MVLAQVWLGRGQAYYDLEIVVGAEWFTTESRDLKFSTYKGGGVEERGIEYIELRASRFMKTIHAVILNKA